MRSLLYSSFIALTLVVSAGMYAPVAHAQSCPTGYSFDANAGCVPIDAATGSNSCQAGYSFDANAGCIPDAATASGSTVDPAAQKAPTTLPPSFDQSGILANVMQWIMSLFAWLLGVAAITLDNAVYYTVVNMGNYVGHLSAVGVTWRILRDIANVMFIFGFLGVGISTILNVERYGWSKKMLPMLVVGAIFLNFSLFITEAMIDTTNFFSTQVYTQINGGQLAGSKGFNPSKEGISDKIMGQLGLQTIYHAGQVNTEVFKAGNSIIIGFMGIILFLVTALVMFALAFILIARFVALIFFIILCPVAFMGLAIPQMNYRAQQWWSHFLEQIITAPVLLLLLYVALAVITDAQFLTGLGGASASDGFLGVIQTSTGTANLGGFASVLLSYLVAMGLLIVVVVKAKNMSAVGASWATKSASALTFGATAYGASGITNATGLGGRKLLQRYAPNSRTARILTRYAFRPLENARVDVRRAGVGKLLEAAKVTEASKPIGKSALGQVTQARTYLKQKAKDANKAYDAETRVAQLKAAITAGDRNKTSKMMRGLSDDELNTPSIHNLLRTNPMAVEALTDHQATILPDNVLIDPGVYLNLSTAKLEAIRRAGNMARANAQTIGRASLSVTGSVAGGLGAAAAPTGTPHPRFAAWFGGRTPDQQSDIRDFWGF